jgi:hypothetical protein
VYSRQSLKRVSWNRTILKVTGFAAKDALYNSQVPLLIKKKASKGRAFQDPK